MSDKLLALWNEVKVTVESLELDVQKSAKGNASAGVRARKGARHLKNVIGEFVKESVKTQRDLKEQKSKE
jgi:uncharacterized protein YaaR (DUF327 family)